MSYVHAISAAGIMYVLTKNCSEGAFLKCGCDDSKTGEVDENGWMWGGCSDNIKFGEKISKQFMDTVEVDSDANSLMNLHNNEAGRKAVRSTLEKRCKCHGVSGSCTLQTCWTQLSDFSTIGRFLRKKYLTASQVDLSRGHLTQSNDFMEVEGDTLAPSKRDLVFLDESPDYCKTNDTIGYSGMVGRECIKKSAIDPTVKDEDAISWLKTSCSRLCRSCGLKVKKKRVVESSNCNCKFMWCCSVKCDQCTKRVTKYTCQPE
ncbi:Wnt8 [Apostichopus japonicus]|uniref:Protein Wnt n=1 Tax=Stichopus japonicus TaxID=307972 RepID=A0A2G8KSN9_STIJA|nr:Wnt8 [Apostichopus japonicus]